MSIVIDETGAVLQWTAVYWRYQARLEHKADSLAEAFDFLSNGEDYGELSSDSILGPDGEVVMDRQQLWNADLAGVKGADLVAWLDQRREIGGAS